MNRRQHEVPLSPREVARVLSICSPEGLLVGGQALAFWADHFDVPLPDDLVSGVTADVDFIGDAALAKNLGRELGWDTWIPSLDEATPQTGKVTAAQSGGGVKQVDFLSGVAGLTTKDIERRAALMEVPRLGQLRVMHPIDVLDSRIQNLNLLPQKRNRAGVAQARLAVAVARAYVRQQVAESGERAALKSVERLAEMAKESASVRVYLQFGIDPLEAVPVDDFRTTPALQARRWPQIVAEASERREAHRAAQARARKSAR